MMRNLLRAVDQTQWTATQPKLDIRHLLVTGDASEGVAIFLNDFITKVMHRDRRLCCFYLDDLNMLSADRAFLYDTSRVSIHSYDSSKSDWQDEAFGDILDHLESPHPEGSVLFIDRLTSSMLSQYRTRRDAIMTLLFKRELNVILYDHSPSDILVTETSTHDDFWYAIFRTDKRNHALGKLPEPVTESIGRLAPGQYLLHSPQRSKTLFCPQYRLI